MSGPSPAAVPRTALLLVALLLPVTLVPGPADAHGETADEHPGTTGDAELAPPHKGYTGPGRVPYLSFFEGAWMYGRVSVSPIHDQIPVEIRASGDWLVWEDGRRNDIFAYNIPAGNGFYITNDPAPQANPEIHGNIVVWEDNRNGPRPKIYAYFLDTGETRRISNGTGSHRNPSVWNGVIAWDDDGAKNVDVRVYDVAEDRHYTVASTEDRESDPLVMDRRVFYRVHRFNIWDLFVHDLDTGETLQITSDALIEGAPYTNGEDVLFLKQFMGRGWVLQRYDARRDIVSETKLRTSDASPVPASREYGLVSALDGTDTQIVAKNLTSGTSTHVSGNLAVVGKPAILGRTAYVAVRTENGTSLLTFEISPFAFGRPPTLFISTPRTGFPWTRPVGVAGVLRMGTGFTEPATFTYRIDDGPPQSIAPAEQFRFTADPKGVEPGNHLLTIRATFREGPPVVASIVLQVPDPSLSVDVGALAPGFHQARLLTMLDDYVLSNPASWLLVPLLLLLLVLLGVRVAYAVRRRWRVRRAEIEWVPPE